MSSDFYFYAFKFVSGAFAFTLLTFGFRSLAISRREEVDQVADQSDRWMGLEELEIIDIFEETSDIKTFKLIRPDKKIPDYAPGQFLSFEIPNDQIVYRSYSISGSSENRNYLQVSIKKIPEGLGSSWFHNLRVGDKVKAHPPAGLFTDNDLVENEHRVFVAGGIGITPLLSMIQTAVDRGQKHKVTLFYGARSQHDLAFGNQLQELARRNPAFTYIPVLSGETIKDWNGLKGFINLDMIKERVENLHKAHYFFCGPAVMTKSLIQGLQELNIPSDQLYSEEFVSPTNISEVDIPSVEVSVTLDGETFQYSGKKNLLEFFEDQKRELPFACRSGVCGACKVKCKAGEVWSLSKSGLNKQEQMDYILTCVSWPKEDLDLES